MYRGANNSPTLSNTGWEAWLNVTDEPLREEARQSLLAPILPSPPKLLLGPPVLVGARGMGVLASPCVQRGVTTLFSRPQSPLSRFPDCHFSGFPQVCALFIRKRGICVVRARFLTARWFVFVNPPCRRPPSSDWASIPGTTSPPVPG